MIFGEKRIGASAIKLFTCLPTWNKLTRLSVPFATTLVFAILGKDNRPHTGA